MRNIKYLIIVFLMLSPFVCSYGDGYNLTGEAYPYPGRVYIYRYDIPTGIQRSYGTVTWKVTNGKIRDSNGDFTLHSLTQPSLHVGDKIYVIWDEDDNDALGSIEIVNNAFMDVYIQSGDVVINDVFFNASHDQYFEGTYLALKNLAIGSRANITFNGYKSVHILPGFETERGCKVRICNDPFWVYSLSETRNLDNSLGYIDDEKDTEFYSLTSTLSEKRVTLSCNISEKSNDAQIYIYNSSGIVIFKKSIDFVGKGNICVDASEWSAGIYLYTLIIDGSISDTKRMIISN